MLASFIGYVKDPRGVLKRRTTRYGFNSAVMVLLLVGIIGFVEAVSYRHNARLDLTSNKRHSLSPQTIQLLKGLKSEVNAVAFYRSDQPGKRVAEDLLLRPVTDHGRLHGALRLHVPALPDPLGLDRPRSCTSCGRRIPFDALFCPYCGYQFPR